MEGSAIPIQVNIKIATPDDRENVLRLVAENAKVLGHPVANFELAADYILKDINYGFFIYATDKATGEPLGFMLFTYEWSDWRDGLFFWLQTAHVTEAHRKSGVFSQMSQYLEKYMVERGSCGLRLTYEKEQRELWQPVISKLKL